MKKNDLLKIFCLAVGLSLGLVLIAKVCYIEEFNSCIPDNDRICLVLEEGRQGGEGDFWTSPSTPGGVAPSLAAEMPEVETATRFTILSFDTNDIVTDDRKVISANIYAGDTNFFDVFKLPVVVGDPKEILAKDGCAMVSRTVAELFGGVDKAIGQTFAMVDNIDKKFTIKGVYEDIPGNCTLRIDILVSIECMGKWALSNWLANERYRTFVLLRDDASFEHANTTLKKVVNKHLDIEELKESNWEIRYNMMTLDDWRKEDTSTTSLKHLMFFLGMALIVIAVMNYLVIVISTLVTRMKEIAVYKCYGASFRQLLAMTFRESATQLVLALALGGLTVFLIKDTAETLLAASMSSLFTLKTCCILVAICLCLLAVTTFVPTYIFTKIPVAAAFRTMRESKRIWKLSLLFFQFAATAVIISLLVLFTRQYRHIEHTDRGYKYERLLVASISGMKDADRERILTDLKKMPEVELASSCYLLPENSYGNNVKLPGKPEELFNYNEMYCVTEDFLDVWEIPIIAGRALNNEDQNRHNMMVSREFERQLQKTTGWKGSVVGRQVALTEHSKDDNDVFTIVGVYEDFRLGSARNFWIGKTAFFPIDTTRKMRPNYLLIKLREMSPESSKKVNDLLANVYQQRTLFAQPYAMTIYQQLNNDRNIRNSLIVCSIAALTIAIIGLLGYTTDEVNRRRKEIAIRKVLGTGNIRILQILSRDTTLIAVPALTIGSVIAYYLAEQWLQDYSDKIELGVLTFILTALFIYIIIEACVILRAYKAANENPTKNLKSE